MGWFRASHFSHVSASRPGGSSYESPSQTMRSSNGGWHGFAGWGCFRRLSETGVGLRADDGADSLSHAGSSFVAADLCLAELRSVSEISCAAGLPRLLAAEARGTAALRHRGAFPADQARRAARRRRRVQIALRAFAGRAKRSAARHIAAGGHASLCPPYQTAFVLASLVQTSGRHTCPRRKPPHDRLRGPPSPRSGPAGTPTQNHRPATP